MLKKTLKRNKGITLIALVVTIIVLLILAGVSISMLTGQNGVLTKAQEAKEKTTAAQQEEQSMLNEYKNQISNYTGINWEQAKANAKAPDEQKEERNNGVIGIGTDGKPVNMDLWEYTYVSVNDSYALNDEEVINNSQIENKGYLGSFNTNGEIEGCVPAFIKSNTDIEFKPVTDMNNTFRECTELKIAPEIPETVTTMFTTFNSCKNLEIPPVLPPKLQNMYGLFYNCNALKYAPDFPETVTNMGQSFVFCKKIESFPKLPNNVVNLNGAFAHNPSLKTAPNIPVSVETLEETFIDCPNLEGTIVIDANPTVYTNLFWETALYGNGLVLTGSSNLLQEFVNTKSDNSNITLKE